MFVTLYTCHARPGKKTAVLDLYREWQALLGGAGQACTELLAGTQDPDEIVMLARFTSEEAAWASAESAQHRAWYARLVGMAESGPFVSYFQIFTGR